MKNAIAKELRINLDALLKIPYNKIILSNYVMYTEASVNKQ